LKKPILISTAAYDGYDLPVVFKEISGHGVELAELAFIEGYTDPFTEEVFSEANAKHIAGLLSEHNLSCPTVSAHMDLSGDSAVDIFKRRMVFARRVGARYMVSNAGARESEQAFMKNIEALALWAEELDMVIALENPGDGRKNVIDNGETIAAVMKEMGSDRIRINYDFGNLLSHCFEKLRPEEDYKLASPFVAQYHIKDVASDASGWYFTEIGKGSIDYSRILTDLAAVAEPIPLSLEIPLRIRRAPDASPRRAASPVDLEEIRKIMAGSLEFVKGIVS
jgi:sugar phosphate isomerase/epimerase